MKWNRGPYLFMRDVRALSLANGLENMTVKNWLNEA
jgi:hypothetical protein